MPDRPFGCSGDPAAGLLGYRSDESESHREEDHGPDAPDILTLDMSPRRRPKVRDLTHLRDGRGSAPHGFYYTAVFSREIDRLMVRLEERRVPGPLRTATAICRHLVVDYFETHESPEEAARDLLRPPRRRARNLDGLRTDKSATRNSFSFLPPFSVETRRVRLALEEMGGDQAPRNGWRDSAVWREIIVRWLEGYESAEKAGDALADELLARERNSR